MRAFTARQEKFCEEYLIDLNASASARRAGYSPKTAFRAGQENMQKPAIQAKIQKAIAARSERTKITSDYVLTSIKEVADTCMQIDPETGRIMNAAAANKALELLGKHLKLFTDRVEAKSDEVITLCWESSGPEEIAG